MQIEFVDPNSESAFHDVMELLIELHKIGGYAPLNIEKLCRDTYAVISQEMTLLASDDDGKPIGLVGLVEEAFYYSDITYLATKWIYVRREHRGAGVLNELLRLCKEIAELKALLLFAQIDNPDRKPKETRTSIQAQTLGYVPHGYILKLRRQDHEQNKRNEAKTECNDEYHDSRVADRGVPGPGEEGRGIGCQDLPAL